VTRSRLVEAHREVEYSVADFDLDLNHFSAYGEERQFPPPIDIEKALAEMQFHGEGDKGVHQTQLRVRRHAGEGRRSRACRCSCGRRSLGAVPVQCLNAGWLA
jgi:hypothetical protein